MDFELEIIQLTNREIKINDNYCGGRQKSTEHTRKMFNFALETETKTFSCAFFRGIKIHCLALVFSAHLTVGCLELGDTV